MLKEKLKLTGTPTFRLYDENGDVKLKFTEPNMIVTSGVSFILSRLTSNAASVMTHIGIGTSGVAANTSQTALIAQLNRTAVTVPGGVAGASTFSYNVSFGPGVGTGSIAEAGVFSASTGGTMLSRITFTPFTKAPADTLVVDWIYELSL